MEVSTEGRKRPHKLGIAKRIVKRCKKLNTAHWLLVIIASLLFVHVFFPSRPTYSWSSAVAERTGNFIDDYSWRKAWSAEGYMPYAVHPITYNGKSAYRFFFVKQK